MEKTQNNNFIVHHEFHIESYKTEIRFIGK